MHASQADLDGPLRPLIDTFYQAAGADAERRIRLFRLAWDYIGSDLGGGRAVRASTSPTPGG